MYWKLYTFLGAQTGFHLTVAILTAIITGVNPQRRRLHLQQPAVALVQTAAAVIHGVTGAL